MRESPAVRIRQALWVIAVVAVAWAWPGAADGAELVGKLVSTSGPVEVRPPGDGPWHLASMQTVLRPGDTVRTGPGGAAEVAFTAGVVRMDENTVLILPTVRAVRTTTGNSQALGLFLEGGRALFRVFKDRLQGTFDVITPSIIVGVKGTTFGVEQGPNLGVIVFEGLVEVAQMGHPDLPSVYVGAGQYTILSRGKLTAPRAFGPDHPSPVWNGAPTKTTSSALSVSAGDLLTTGGALAKDSDADQGTGASTWTSTSNAKGPNGSGSPGQSSSSSPGAAAGSPGAAAPVAAAPGSGAPGSGAPPQAGHIPPGQAKKGVTCWKNC